MDWHLKDIDDVLIELNTSRDGLSAEEAARRLEVHGPNILKEMEKRSVVRMFVDQFTDFMILVLIAAAVVSGIIGDLTDTIAIVVIVVLNAVIGFVQEYRAEKAMAALKKMASPTATVVREGRESEIAASELVPGDVVLLEAGKIVPADLRIVEAARLKAEESALTGESVPVEKHGRALKDEGQPLGDRRNMLYKGTTVSYGRGRGITVATAMQTELGKIASMLQEQEEVKTPLQKRLASFGRKLAVSVIVICVVVFLFGVARGEAVLLMLLTAISLAVAAIPEALPAVVTISLAIGAKKMVRQNVLIRKLPAVETLGSVTFICSDKTGTLTLNRMSVEEVYVDGEVSRGLTGRAGTAGKAARDELTGSAALLMTAFSVSNDARRNGGGNMTGDPTEIALYAAAAENGFRKEDLEREFPRVAEVPFDSERKCMTTFHRRDDGTFVSFTKGAVEAILEKSEGTLISGKVRPPDREKITDTNERMAADGLRVLCVAMREWDELPDKVTPENTETGLVILGLAGMMDPPREEAIEAVALCRKAGIEPVMITGDHPLTARTISERLGILKDNMKSVVTGKDLAELSQEEFEARVKEIKVYARVSPEQKLRIIRGLQDKGQFVAMTGDGVNDAPALRRADIGVAMGITGTDVAKESAHMILLDDNFATIVRAVKEGRRIFDNIRKFIKYTMASNSGEIWTIFLAPFLGLPVPLLPIHILWINLVTDGLPGLALAAEPPDGDVMKRPPRHPKESIFAHRLGFDIIWVGLLMGGVSIITQGWALKSGNPHWQTMVFTVLCLSQMGNVLAIRSDRESFFSQGFLTNLPLAGAFLLTLILQLATIYVPFLNPIFKTSPLPARELAFTLAMSSVVFFAVEGEKLFRRLRSRSTAHSA
ncbi:MAG: cation-translocating P-type ATPase [Candidatus Sulfobium sp.]|jgi:Ca2+-transporting ATPase